MLYEIKNATLSMNGNEILSHFNFRMVDGDKIGIVGRNGSGKTTFLRFVMGEIEFDYNDDNTMGELIKSSDLKIGYLSQISFKNTNVTVYEELIKVYDDLLKAKHKIDLISEELDKSYNEKKAIELNNLIDYFNANGGLTYEKELKVGFVQFGFELSDLNKKLSEFSGGQTTKIALLKLLLSKPALLILDEPTNHLDITAIEWMEEYLKSYKNNIIVVSHDRMFLDNICDIIYEVEHKQMKRYVGNYSDFMEQKELNYEIELAKYNNNIKEIERLTALADRFRFKATKAKMVKSKEKQIEKIKQSTFRPLKKENKNFHYDIVPTKESGKVVLRCEELVVGYKDNLISKVNLVVNKGDRLGIVGKNGTGKSTFLKTIVEKIHKISGQYSFGHNVEYEYFDQSVAEDYSEETIFDNFQNIYKSYNNEQIRKCLGRFLFTDNDINKKVCSLSGGEKVRLAFAKMFEKKPNLLILDEPTNHLDILGKESLENIIADYKGTVIFVSHDRYFTKRVANKILLFEDKKTLLFTTGYDDYEYYEDKKKGKIVDDKINYDLITSSLDDVKKEEKGLDYSELFTSEKYTSLDEANREKLKYEELLKQKISDDKTELTQEDIDNIVLEKNEQSKLSGKESFLLSKEKAKREKRIQKIEKDLEDLEEQKKIFEEKLNDETIQRDFEKLYEAQTKIEDIIKKIDELYEEWSALQE